MSKKDFEDLIFYQSRISSKDKKNFRNFIFERAGELGLKSELYPRSGTSKNIVIGDLKKAKYIIGSFYDTPLSLPASLLQMGPIALFIINALCIIISLLILIIMPKVFYLIIPFVIILFYNLGLFGGAKKFNFNATSGILCLLDLMKKVGTMSNNIAYVFLDNHFKGYKGAKAMAKQMQKDGLDPTERKVIIIDRIGLGNYIVLDYFRETKFVDEVKVALESSKAIKSKIVLRDGSITNTSDHVGFKKFHQVCIFGYNYRTASGYVNDKESYRNDRMINHNNIDFLVEGLKTFIETHVKIEEKK